MIVLQILGVFAIVLAFLSLFKVLAFVCKYPELFPLREHTDADTFKQIAAKIWYADGNGREILDEAIEKYCPSDIDQDNPNNLGNSYNPGTPNEPQNPNKRGDRGKRSGGVSFFKQARTAKTTRFR